MIDELACTDRLTNAVQVHAGLGITDNSTTSTLMMLTVAPCGTALGRHACWPSPRRTVPSRAGTARAAGASDGQLGPAPPSKLGQNVPDPPIEPARGELETSAPPELQGRRVAQSTAQAQREPFLFEDGSLLFSSEVLRTTESIDFEDDLAA